MGWEIAGEKTDKNEYEILYAVINNDSQRSQAYSGRRKKILPITLLQPTQH